MFEPAAVPRDEPRPLRILEAVADDAGEQIACPAREAEGRGLGCETSHTTAMSTSAAAYGASPSASPHDRPIALFVRSFGGGGGAERVMLNLASALAARGHPLDLVMGRREGRFLEDIPDTVTVVDLAVGSPRRLLPAVRAIPHVAGRLGSTAFTSKAAWLLSVVPALTAYLNRRRPTALLSALGYPNVAALLACRSGSAPTRVVVSEHNHLSTSVARAHKRHKKIFPNLAARLYPAADGIVAVSHGVADDLAQTLRLPRSRITTIYNPVFRSEIAIEAQARPAHAWLAPDTPPVLLGIGKLKPQKDFACLIRAFARVRATRPVRLILLGDGPQREALLALARTLGVADAIALPGFVANPFAYLGRAAAFVLSSAWEGLANVVIEALACGCPVVSTDCPSGPAEILAGGKYGRLVPVGDDRALANAIAATLDAPPGRERLRDRARDFSVDRAATQYRRVLLGR